MNVNVKIESDKTMSVSLYYARENL